MRTIEELIDLDCDYYRLNNVDLATFTDHELIKHYFEHGYREGRASSRLATRDDFVGGLNERRVLEIGPFCSPTIIGERVDYADHLSTEELRDRARELDMDPSNVPDIKHVLRGGSLSGITDTYEVVFSSHNLEHQPDIISHFNEVSSLLEPGGCFALIVPNAHYCFDANLPLSKISDIVGAFHEGRRTHSLGAVIDHRALTTHNDSGAHWEDRLNGRQRYAPIDTARVAAALREFEAADGGYIDVHGWQFDPFSLSDIVNCLIDLRLIDFAEVRCNGPVRGTNEFTITLLKG